MAASQSSLADRAPRAWLFIYYWNTIDPCYSTLLDPLDEEQRNRGWTITLWVEISLFSILSVYVSNVWDLQSLMCKHFWSSFMSDPLAEDLQICSCYQPSTVEVLGWNDIQAVWNGISEGKRLLEGFTVLNTDLEAPE